MLLRFSHLKMVRPNQTTFTSSGITTQVESANFDIQPLGAAGTTAPSTIVVDRFSGYEYYLNKPYSAVHAALTAVTSTDAQVNLL